MNAPNHEEILTIRCQLGEPSAWKDFVHIWHPRLMRFVKRMHGDSSISEDLLQNIWLKVVRSLVRLKDPSKTKAWMYRIARNVVMDQLRSQYREPTTEVAIDFQESNDALEAFALTDQINSSLQHLHPMDREVVVLFYLEEFPISDVAEACGIPVGTAKSRLYRSRQILRKVIKNE